MYQDRDLSQRYIKRRKSRKSSSMMMFAMAAALLITGGALGTPWLTDLFGAPGSVSSADEAGVACPSALVGLSLVAEGEVQARGDLFELECTYVLPPSSNASATVTVTWTESGSHAVLERGCGLPPSITPGVFNVEGSYYGSLGQSRADYHGQTRYSSAMQGLASDLAASAASISEPCPVISVGTNPGVPGETGEPGDGGTPGGQGSANPDGGSGSSGGGSGQQPGPGTPVATVTGGSQDSTTGGTATATPVDVPEGSCLVRGRVTDSRGIAVPNIELSVFDATQSLVAGSASDATGTYSFTPPVEVAGRVSLSPSDAGRSQAVFQVLVEQGTVTLSRDLASFDDGSSVCEVNFEIWNLDDSYAAGGGNLDRWPSIIELYQNFNRAAELAGTLGAPLDSGLPVPVYAWCNSSNLFCDPTGQAEFAFYSGTTVGRQVDEPYVALGFPSSEIGYRGSPDNREYHEFGHAFLADVIGNQVPVHVGDTNHGGYYRNEMTTDSYIEGFAEFYSVMVTKHIEQADNPQRYKIGAEYDIEADRKPWEAVGWWEEFTLAGLLLDFEDGDADYASAADEIEVESVTSLSAGTGNFAIGRVRNLGAKVAHSPEVTVKLLDSDGSTVFTQVTAVRPESLGPGQTGVFYVAAPSEVEFSDVEASAGRTGVADDDGIDLELADIISVVTSDWGAGPDQITSVKQLYDAFSREFAGQDVDGNGTVDATESQVDDIFIKHGFFDDMDGDRVWNSANDGEIGGSAHPAAVVGRNEFREITPRSSATGFAGSFVDIDTGGVDADLLVQVEMDEGADSYAYWTSSGTMTPVELAVPGADGERAAVTVIAAAEDRNPAVAYRTTARQFHAAVDAGEITTEPVSTRVELEQGEPFALLGTPDGGGSGNTRAGVPPWAMILPIILAGLMLGGGVYLMRRTGNPGGGQ